MANSTATNEQFDLGQIQIGISSCLLGNNVRYNGGHKRSNFCTDVLEKHVTYVPLCPEVAIGLGTPRPTIKLLAKPGDQVPQALRHRAASTWPDDQVIVRVVDSTDHSIDVTDPMREYGKQQGQALTQISGYIFCAKSPSCGMERVKLTTENLPQGEATGVGIFAKEIMTAQPLLPVEEDGRLNDAPLRENFITRVYAYRRWQLMNAEGTPSVKQLTKFHADHKYLLMAHDPETYKLLGPIVAEAKGQEQQACDTYIAAFMKTLAKPASRRRQVNVLMHLQGYFKKQLNAAQKAELSDVIRAYQEGLKPLYAPLTLLAHYLREYPNPYLEQQVYLNPHPDEMRLRYRM